jgi:hypothetical protein
MINDCRVLPYFPSISKVCMSVGLNVSLLTEENKKAQTDDFELVM